MYYSNSQQHNSVPFYQERRKFFLQNAVFFCDRLYVVHNFNSARYAQDVNTLQDRPTLPSDVIRDQPCLDVCCLVFENGLRVVKKGLVLPPIFHVFFLFLKKNEKTDYLICLSFIYKPYFDIWGSGNIGI